MYFIARTRKIRLKAEDETAMLKKFGMFKAFEYEKSPVSEDEGFLFSDLSCQLASKQFMFTRCRLRLQQSR